MILGLGQSGLAMARWSVRQNWKVTVIDTRPQPPCLTQLQQQLPQAQFHVGPFGADWLDAIPANAVYKSPGLSPQQVAPLWDAARAHGLHCGTELTLFSSALEQLERERSYRPRVLAITGTNGKTTVAALTATMLKRAGVSVALAGNIGPTMLDTLMQHLDGELPQTWVLELSSFQLNDCQGFDPDAATILNFSQDHLDWHTDMAAYAAAKGRIFGPQTLRVLRRDDPAVSFWMKASDPGAKLMTFGGDLPRRPGDFGLETDADMTWLVRAKTDDHPQKFKTDTEPEPYLQRLIPADALRIRGRHNALNALAALALAASTGQTLAPMLYGLREFVGAPHRVETIAVSNRVEYFDDSKGTNVGATAAAIEGLGVERRVWVILGGDGKGQDFSPLSAPLKRYAGGAALIGRDAPKLGKLLADGGIPFAYCDDLVAAVTWCRQRAQPGDAVLLSPACASFDMFEDYGHRAAVFRQAVQDISICEAAA